MNYPGPPGADWRKSSRSSGNGGDCVEVTRVDRRQTAADDE
ncbi:DUF397 domain-containing protein [Actinomadura sp. DC4]